MMPHMTAVSAGWPDPTPAEITKRSDGWSLIVVGKGNRQRVVPITQDLAAEIACYRGHGYLFPGQIDGHMSPEWVGAVLSRLMPPGYTAHKLRHRFATRGYAGTHDLRAVQEALGHASVATTQRYTAVSSREVRLVSEAAGHRGGNDAA
jgi:integrase/recombinase XerC